MSGSDVPTQRALVTGGAGFIGSHIVDRLVREGWESLRSKISIDSSESASFFRMTVRSTVLSSWTIVGSMYIPNSSCSVALFMSV